MVKPDDFVISKKNLALTDKFYVRVTGYRAFGSEREADEWVKEFEAKLGEKSTH
jgi:hypothetical protein